VCLAGYGVTYRSATQPLAWFEIRSASYCRNYLTCIKFGLGISSSCDVPVTINESWGARQWLVYGLTTDKPLFDYQHWQEIFLFIQTSWGPPRPGVMRQWREADRSTLPSSEFKVSGTIHTPLPPYAFIECTAPTFFLCMFELRLHTLRWQQNIQTSQKSQPISRFRPFDVQVGHLRHYLWFGTGQLAWTVKSEEIIWNSNWRVRTYFIDL